MSLLFIYSVNFKIVFSGLNSLNLVYKRVIKIKINLKNLFLINNRSVAFKMNPISSLIY